MFIYMWRLLLLFSFVRSATDGSCTICTDSEGIDGGKDIHTVVI